MITKSRAYDPSQLEADRKIPLIPLVCDILKTPAVWVDMCGDFLNGVGFYIMLSEVTTYHFLTQTSQGAGVL